MQASNSVASRLWFLAGVAGASLLVCGALLHLFADAGGRLHWAVALLVQALCLLAVILVAAAAMRRQQARIGDQRATLEREIRGLEADTGALFEHLSRDFEPQFDAVRGETEQIHCLLLDAIDKLVDSFTAMDLASRQQRDHALAVIGRQHEALSAETAPEDKVEQLRLLETETAHAVEELSAIAATIGSHVNTAVTSLQFQDMTAQLLEQITLRIDAMQSITRQITALPGSSAAAAGTTYAERVAHLRSAVRETSDLIARNNRSPVTQKDMSAGEVELF